MSFNSLIDGGNYTYPGICLIQLAIIKWCILTYSDKAKLQSKRRKQKSQSRIKKHHKESKALEHIIENTNSYVNPMLVNI